MKPSLFLTAALALAACGSPDAPGSQARATPACAASPGGAVSVEGAWVRAQNDAAAMSAAYFTVCNGSSEPVIIEGLSTPLAGLAELHETTRDAAGVVRMAPTGPIALAPGEAVVFAPGGKHAMLMELPAPIAEGSKSTLTIELAGGASVSAEVKAVSAIDAAGHQH